MMFKFDKKQYSIAMTQEKHRVLVENLKRNDQQEDLCFALYNPTLGFGRFTAVIDEIILPKQGERNIHGNASFNPEYFESVLKKATEHTPPLGIAFLHSHPKAHTWQRMSFDDQDAESGMAGAAYAATGLPLVALTLSGKTEFWSARVWKRKKAFVWDHIDCESVRVVGKKLSISRPPFLCEFDEVRNSATERTIHAWGEELHQKLIGTKIGIVGLGSVGSFVAEALARMGVKSLTLIDNDIIKTHNLDRTINAYTENASAKDFKVIASAKSITKSATALNFQVNTVKQALQKEEAYRHALDCDVIFSCVDRPWGRSILNFIAYAHLIPVIDGGISCSVKKDGTMRSADWGVFVGSPERACLECQNQYNAGDVALEREGSLENQQYIDSLPENHHLKQKENVFVFSMALASQEILSFVQLLEKISGVEAADSLRTVFPANNIYNVPHISDSKLRWIWYTNPNLQPMGT